MLVYLTSPRRLAQVHRFLLRVSLTTPISPFSGNHEYIGLWHIFGISILAVFNQRNQFTIEGAIGDKYCAKFHYQIIDYIAYKLDNIDLC